VLQHPEGIRRLAGKQRLEVACVCKLAGYFCVYNSKSSLTHVQQCLESSQLGDLQRENRLDFHGMPVVVVLGHNPGADERMLSMLREGGQLLADRWVWVCVCVSIGINKQEVGIISP